MDTIIAREQEKEKLSKLLTRNEAQFLAIYGRRRVGKTFLIREFFKKQCIYFEVTGTKDASIGLQLKNFMLAYEETFGQAPSVPCTTWHEAFTALRKEIEKIPSEHKIVIFLDELPWLATAKSGLLQTLDHTWNRYLSQMPNVILIVCGSSAAWMLKKIIHNRGGLYGRLTDQICLMPYTLSEVERYLHSKHIVLERKQIIDLYMVFGGVPKYLSTIERGKSPQHIIQETCFTPHAMMALEYNKLFASLFKNYQQHTKLIEALATKRSGLTQSELIAQTDFVSGGNLTRILDELEASGFILFVPEFWHKKRQGRWRVIDEYSLFYLCWIKPAIVKHLSKLPKTYWESMRETPSFFSWSGYAFEGVCLKHIDKILKALELSVVSRAVSTWNYRGVNEGCQIDLIIERSDRCYNLCEIKFTNKPFVVTKEYAEKLKRKKELFREVTKTKYSLFTTLITTYGVVENSHYYDVVDVQCTMDALF